MASFSESFERSWSESESFLSSSLGLLDLPSEVLALILRYLPLSDLANTRLVCTRLQKLVDAKSSTQLWASAPLSSECTWVSNDNRRVIERAASCGNVEALIKLALAYLYDEGVPACDGKGSYESLNGIKATEYLIQAEALCSSRVSLFSWVLFRPPWSLEVVSSKMCVFHHMRLACQNAEAKQQSLPGIHYSVGKALSFYTPLDDDDYVDQGENLPPSAVQGAGEPLDWYERGAARGCPFSALEVWKTKCKPQLREDELEYIRQLRGILFTGDLFEAQLELCRAYAMGFYGGISEGQALGYIRQTMDQAKPSYTERMFALQDLSPDSRYILLDWLFEVSCLKEYPPHVAHLIINMVDSYLLRRHVCKAKLQLLAIAAALLASRWCMKESLTIREASWLTDRTYDYDDVVRMIGELVAVHKGNIRKPTIVDYLDILLSLIKADTVTRHMSYYLSESILLYPKFGRFSPSFLAAACLLEARVLLGHDYPWSLDLVQATGLTVGDLKSCCLMMYQLCLTDKYRITDSREVQLKAIITRYGSEDFSEVSHMTLMSYKELKEQLGWDQDISLILFTPPVSAKKKTNKVPKHKKRLSFLSDSQYLTSPPSDLASDSELDEAGVDSSSESHSCSSPRLSDSRSSSLSESLSESQNDVDPDFAFLVSPPGCGIRSPSPSSSSPSHCSSQSLVINPNGSGFPQPDFCSAAELEEDRQVYDRFITACSSLRDTSSSGSSSLYEPTTVGEPLHLMVEDTNSCSTSETSIASGSSGNNTPTFVDEDSKFSDDKMSTFVDEDSRSIMDTLPPCPSNPQTDELSSFVSSLPLPTPSFSGTLERDAENTPFELDPVSSTNHTLAAVKQNLHLGSCEPKHLSHHHIMNPRVPLQSVENLIREPTASSKDVIPLAKVSGRARNFTAKNTDSKVMNHMRNIQ